jgi:hypothetical protein
MSAPGALRCVLGYVFHSFRTEERRRGSRRSRRGRGRAAAAVSVAASATAAVRLVRVRLATPVLLLTGLPQ